jgi:hypothetical protein
MKRRYQNDYEQIIEYVAVGVFGVIIAANSLARPSASSINPFINAAQIEQSQITSDSNMATHFALLN